MTSEGQQQHDEDKNSSLSFSVHLGAFSVLAAATEHGYDRMDWKYGEGDFRTFYNSSVVAVEKKIPKKPTDGGGVIEIRVMVYPEKRVVALCVFDGKKERSERGRRGAEEDDDEQKYGDLFNTNHKYLYVAPNVNDINTLAKILSSPLEYGKERGLCYSRHDNFVDKWSPSIQSGLDMTCSNCGKRGVHVDDTEHRRRGKTLLRACTKCKRVLYCSTKCQRSDWKSWHRTRCTEQRDFDSARRWCYIAVTSGLTSDPTELEAIRDICNRFDLILFEDGAPPCLCRARYGCGAICTLSNMLLDIGRDYHDIMGFTDIREAMAVHKGRSDSVCHYDVSFPPCRNTRDFREEYGDEIDVLSRKLRRLRSDVRSELISWQFERIRCDWKIMMITSEQKPLVDEERTFPIHFSNMDYSRLVFGEVDDKIYCYMHGTVDLHSNDGEEEDDNTEANTSADEDDVGEVANFEKESLLAEGNPGYETDIGIVRQAASCSRARAVNALCSHAGDIVEAIMDIIGEKEGNGNDGGEDDDIEEEENYDLVD